MCSRIADLSFFQFGDAAKFQPELNTVAARVQKQEAELSALQVKYFLHWIEGSFLCGYFKGFIDLPEDFKA